MADREKLIELVGQVQDCGCDVTDVVEMNYVENSVLVDHLIANGVTVRERGRWVLQRYYGGVRKGMVARIICSECGYPNEKTNFCPNCGADMRGDEDGNET